MRKRVQIALAVLLVAVVGGIARQALPQPEPVYQGRGLRAWLHEAVKERRYATGHAAIDAVRQIGTNAIPIFLEMLRDEDSTALKDEAVAGFWFLNTDDAQQAVPALIRIHEHDTSPSSQEAALCALGYIGPGPAARAAIPSLLREIAGSNSIVRFYAVRALSGIHADASAVVPALAKLLSDDDPIRRDSIRREAARGLGFFGKNAQSAVPALIRLLSDQNDEVRSAATNALKAIDPEAPARAGVK